MRAATSALRRSSVSRVGLALRLSGRIPQWSPLQVRQHLGKGLGVRIRLRERQPHPPGRDLDPCSDLQQLQPQRGALGAGELRALSSESS